jgi:hypothetical protein
MAAVAVGVVARIGAETAIIVVVGVAAIPAAPVSAVAESTVVIAAVMISAAIVGGCVGGRRQAADGEYYGQRQGRLACEE